MKKIIITIFFNIILLALAKDPSSGDDLNVKEVLTEEKLLEIIKIAENSPDPESNVNIDENIQEKKIFNTGERLHLEQEYSVLIKKYYDFLDKLNEEIKEHKFEDKTKVVPINNEVSKELISDNLIENFEIGIGMKYQGLREETYRFDEEQSSRSYTNTHLAEENEFGSIPIYATGKYNFSTRESGGQPYLKLNFGYYVERIENREKEVSSSGYSSFNESMEYSKGRYYGVGGGIEYTNGLTFDVMYQVNKDSDNKNADEDDRVTFSVEYRLDL